MFSRLSLYLYNYSGSVHGGHYIVYIRPLMKHRVYHKSKQNIRKKGQEMIQPTDDVKEDTMDTTNDHPPEDGAVVSFHRCKWYRFDDDRVQLCKAREAVDACFGGDIIDIHYEFGQLKRDRRTTFANAYMLIYLRKSQIDAYMPSTMESIPKTQLHDAAESKDAGKVLTAKATASEERPAPPTPTSPGAAINKGLCIHIFFCFLVSFSCSSPSFVKAMCLIVLNPCTLLFVLRYG